MIGDASTRSALESSPVPGGGRMRPDRGEPSDVPSFFDLADARARTVEAPSDEEAWRAYKNCLAVFEKRYGVIEEVYWGSGGTSGVARTAPQLRVGRRVSSVHVHVGDRVSNVALLCAIEDWRTLAVKARMLSGRPSLQLTERVFTALSNLVSIADRDLSVSDLAIVLGSQAREFAEANAFYAGNAKRLSYAHYFWGMIFGVICNGILAFGAAEFIMHAVPYFWPGIAISNNYSARAFACVIAGAIGALLSVLLRMSGDKFELSAEMGFLKTALIGSFRPFIGAVSGLVLFFAFSAGFVNFFSTNTGSPNTNNFFALGLLALLSGFSERFAGRTYIGIEQAVSVRASREHRGSSEDG